MNETERTTINYYIGTGLFLILIFTALKPEGTEDANVLIRIAVWSLNIGLLLPMLIALQFLLQMVSSFNQLNPWVKLVLAGMLGSLIFVPLGLLIDFVFGLEAGSLTKERMGHVAALLDEFLGTLFPVTFTWVALNAPRMFKLNFAQMEGPAEYGQSAVASEKTQPQPAGFLKLIQREIGKDVVYIKSELHYVRAVTIKGEKLVLYNLKDAIVELEKIWEGIQTHRSYWVSGRFIETLQNEKGKKYLLAGKGSKIPISRRRVKAVKEYLEI